MSKPEPHDPDFTLIVLASMVLLASGIIEWRRTGSITGFFTGPFILLWLLAALGVGIWVYILPALFAFYILVNILAAVFEWVCDNVVLSFYHTLVFVVLSSPLLGRGGEAQGQGQPLHPALVHVAGVHVAGCLLGYAATVALAQGLLLGSSHVASILLPSFIVGGGSFVFAASCFPNNPVLFRHTILVSQFGYLSEAFRVFMLQLPVWDL